MEWWPPQVPLGSLVVGYLLCVRACMYITSFLPCVLAKAPLHSQLMFQYYFKHQEKVAGNEMEQAYKSDCLLPCVLVIIIKGI